MSNAAKAGGGGVLLWDGTMPHIVAACPPGFEVVKTDQNLGNATCVPCRLGYFKETLELAYCTTCEAGKYTHEMGASICISCFPDTFQNGTGA